MPWKRIGFGAGGLFLFSFSFLKSTPTLSKFQSNPSNFVFFSSYLVSFLLINIFFILNKPWNYKYFLISSPLIFNLSDLVLTVLITICLFLISYKIIFHPLSFFLSFNFCPHSFDYYLFCLGSFSRFLFFL